MKVEGNFCPDHLTRDRLSANAGYQLVAAIGQYYVSPPGITTTGHEDPMCEQLTKPRNHREAVIIEVLKANNLLGPVKAISISQLQGEYGIDVCVPSSATDRPRKYEMALITVCRGTSQFTRQALQVFCQRQNTHEVHHTHRASEDTTDRDLLLLEHGATGNRQQQREDPRAAGERPQASE